MSEPLKINTKKFQTGGKVEVDGKVWDVKLKGAGSELRYSQAQRQVKLYAARLANLDKKIEAGEATNEELDKYEQYSHIYEENEQIVYQELQTMFRDSTDDNSEVKKWLDETPIFAVLMAFEEVNNGVEQSNETSDSSRETESS